MDKIRGCGVNETAAENFKHVTRNGLRFDRCPKAWVRDEAQQESLFLADFVFLDNHKILPNPGGRLDQCPRFLEAVDIIQIEKTNITIQHRKREEQKMKAARARGRRGK